jgi:hypothetical protein
MVIHRRELLRLAAATAAVAVWPQAAWAETYPSRPVRMSACGRVLRPWLGRTLLPAAVLDPSGQESLAGARPCRTDGARSRWKEYWPADARGPRAQQAGKLEARALFGKPRRNGRASEQRYLRSAICATRSKAPAIPRSDTDHTRLDRAGARQVQELWR